MWDVGGKIFKGIKSTHVNSLACVRVQRVESKCFKIDISLALHSVYEFSDEIGENEFGFPEASLPPFFFLV